MTTPFKPYTNTHTHTYLPAYLVFAPRSIRVRVVFRAAAPLSFTAIRLHQPRLMGSLSIKLPRAREQNSKEIEFFPASSNVFVLVQHPCSTYFVWKTRHKHTRTHARENKTANSTTIFHGIFVTITRKIWFETMRTVAAYTLLLRFVSR